MKKLNINTFKERAEAIIKDDLLFSINGGLENSCHVVVEPKPNGDIDIHIYK